jgi:hypothetical protein
MAGCGCSRPTMHNPNSSPYDGDDWTIVDTPPHLHGWNHLGSEMAVAADGLFVYDGVYMWRYAFCTNE